MYLSEIEMAEIEASKKVSSPNMQLLFDQIMDMRNDWNKCLYGSSEFIIRMMKAVKEYKPS